jgi:hypothetical protein
MAQPAPAINPTQLRLEQISHPCYPLCREDLIWVLELVKKKVTEQDPAIMDLDQPQLIHYFQNFAELALKLIHQRATCYSETEPLKAWIHKSSYFTI